MDASSDQGGQERKGWKDTRQMNQNFFMFFLQVRISVFRDPGSISLATNCDEVRVSNLCP